jgi:hypothetical protein
MKPRAYSGWRFVLYWVGFSVLLPLAALLLAWIGTEVYGVNDPLMDFLGSGDLIPICALLLLGVWLDIMSDQEDKHWMILVSEVCFIFLGITSLIAYGFAKAYGISVTTMNASVDHAKLAADHDVLHLVGQLSCVFCGYTVIHAVVVKVALVYKAQIKEVRHEL